MYRHNHHRGSSHRDISNHWWLMCMMIDDWWEIAVMLIPQSLTVLHCRSHNWGGRSNLEWGGGVAQFFLQNCAFRDIFHKSSIAHNFYKTRRPNIVSVLHIYCWSHNWDFCTKLYSNCTFAACTKVVKMITQSPSFTGWLLLVTELSRQI